MAVNVETTGSGSIGEVTPEWSVQEYATPVVAGSRAGGVGGVSFGAKKNDDSSFIINNDSTFTHDTLGDISGVIKSASISGEVVSVTQTNDIYVFDGEEEVPGLVSGGVHQTVDLLNQIVKKDVRLKSGLNGGFWSLAGHNVGFDSKGNQLEFKQSRVNYSWIGSPSNTNYKQSVINYRHSLWAIPENHQYRFYNLFANYVYGDNIVSDINKPNYFLAFKTGLNPNYGFSWQTTGFPSDSVTNTDRYLFAHVDRPSREIGISVEYRSGGSIVSDEQILTLDASIDMSQELAVFIEYNLVSVNQNGSYTYKFKATVCNTYDYTIYTTVELNFTADAMPIWYDRWTLGVNAGGYNDVCFRSIWVDNSTQTKAIAEWENPASYSISSAVVDANVISTPVIGGKYNMWQFLQDACSAHGQEISISNGTTQVRVNGELQLDITNIVASPSLTVETSFSGETVDIVYADTNATWSGGGDEEVYNAYTDKNRIISVNASETITTTVKTDNYFLGVLPSIKSSIFPNAEGYYAVCDSTGANIADGTWRAYGGNVKVSINKDDKTSLDIKLIGPTREIPGKTGPYSLAYSSGEEKYAALSVVGAAIYSAPKTLTLVTGAPEDKSSQKNSATVKNSHISSIDNAYTAGLWVSANASGPRVAFSGNIPVSSIDGFGLTAGSLFKYEDAIYRVDSTSIGNLGVSINATLFTRCNDFDTLWSSKTVQYHDELWSGYEVQDQIIKPLWNVTLSGVYMTFDGDGIVTWTDEAYGEATFALDTDGVPYVIASGDDESNTLIYLDTDFTPYYV